MIFNILFCLFVVQLFYLKNAFLVNIIALLLLLFIHSINHLFDVIVSLCVCVFVVCDCGCEVFVDNPYKEECAECFHLHPLVEPVPEPDVRTSVFLCYDFVLCEHNDSVASSVQCIDYFSYMLFHVNDNDDAYKYSDFKKVAESLFSRRR